MLVGLRHQLAEVAGVLGVSKQDLPAVRHALEEGLDTGVRAQVSSKAKRLTVSQASFYNKQGVPGHLGLLKDVALLPVQDTTDTTTHLFQTLDLHKVNKLPEIGHSDQYGGVEAA